MTICLHNSIVPILLHAYTRHGTYFSTFLLLQYLCSIGICRVICILLVNPKLKINIPKVKIINYSILTLQMQLVDVKAFRMINRFLCISMSEEENYRTNLQNWNVLPFLYITNPFTYLIYCKINII